jgi:hypothetical protein
MTVLAFGAGEGQLLTVTDEQPGDHGEVTVTLAERTGLIHADLNVGANVAAAQKHLRALEGISQATASCWQLFRCGLHRHSRSKAQALERPSVLNPSLIAMAAT